MSVKKLLELRHLFLRLAIILQPLPKFVAPIAGVYIEHLEFYMIGLDPLQAGFAG
jgi:hypothetical protein